MAPTWKRGLRTAALVAAFTVLGCGGPVASTAPPSGPPSTLAATGTLPSSLPSAGPSDVAPPTAHPGNGVADPDGRIAFGRVASRDRFYGTVVAIWAIDPDGSDLVQLTVGGSGFPAWSPDGSRLAFTQLQPDGTFQIATSAPDGTDVKVLTAGAGADNASWFPDGSLIVFQRQSGSFTDPDFHTTLWWMNSDGTNLRQVGDPEAFDIEPKVSPSGSEILFTRLTFENDQARQQLVSRSIATGEERVLPAGRSVEHPSWSPDGRWIAYNISPALGGAAPNDQVMRIPADGSGPAEMLFEGTDDQGGFKPVYSPDGRRILFGCFLAASATDAVCLMDADGANFDVLVDEPSIDENHFSWGPPVTD